MALQVADSVDTRRTQSSGSGCHQTEALAAPARRAGDEPPCGHWEVPHQGQERPRLGFLLLEGLSRVTSSSPGTPDRTDRRGRRAPIVGPFARRRAPSLPRAVARPVARARGRSRRGVRPHARVVAPGHERAARPGAAADPSDVDPLALLQLSPVETRLHVLFWHLAERWGHVTPDGVSVRMRMSHKLLGQLVGCRRTSVTTALRRIAESGLVDGGRTVAGFCTARLPTSSRRSTGPTAPRSPVEPALVSVACQSPSSSAASSARRGRRPRPSRTWSARCSTCATASTWTPSPSAG